MVELTYNEWFADYKEHLDEIFNLLKRYGSYINKERFYQVAFKYSDTTILPKFNEL